MWSSEMPRPHCLLRTWRCARVSVLFDLFGLYLSEPGLTYWPASQITPAGPDGSSVAPPAGPRMENVIGSESDTREMIEICQLGGGCGVLLQISLTQSHSIRSSQTCSSSPPGDNTFLLIGVFRVWCLKCCCFVWCVASLVRHSCGPGWESPRRPVSRHLCACCLTPVAHLCVCVRA